MPVRRQAPARLIDGGSLLNIASVIHSGHAPKLDDNSPAI
jgi:hypothetical protein